MGAPSVSAVSVRLGDGAGLPTLHHDSAPLRPHLRVAPPVQSPQSAAVTRATSQIDHPVPPPALNPISLAQVDACTDVTVRCRSRTTFACSIRGASRRGSTRRCVSPHLPPPGAPLFRLTCPAVGIADWGPSTRPRAFERGSRPRKGCENRGECAGCERGSGWSVALLPLSSCFAL